MSCKHDGFTQYAYCGLCGASLLSIQCQCGNMINPSASFCTQCGVGVINPSTQRDSDQPDRRYNLSEMLRLNNELEISLGTEKSHASQDDIDELFKSGNG